MGKRWKIRQICLALLFSLIGAWIIYNTIYGRRIHGYENSWDKREEDTNNYDPLANDNKEEDERIYGPLFTHEIDVNKDIFFFEMSGRNILHPRHACAIEAASRHMEYTRVYVLMLSSDLNYKDDIMLGLVTLPNIKFRQINPEFYFRLSGVESWYLRTYGRNVTVNDPVMAHLLEQSLRYSFLYYHGGTYLSKDFILMKSINSLPEGLGFQSHNSIGDAFMKLKIDHPLLQKVLQMLPKKFQKSSWDSIGVPLIEEVLQTSCKLDRIGELQHTDCPIAPKIHPSSFFYPIEENKNSLFFDLLRANIVKKTLAENDPYGVNIWNPMNASLRKTDYQSEDIALLQLAKRYCPLVYYTVNDK